MKRLALVLFLLWTACDMDSFLFNSDELDEYTLPGNTIPESRIESVTFESSGGNTLYGFYVSSENPDEAKTILYCHGNRDHIDHYWERVMLLDKLGLNLLIFDYQGFGRSEGETSEKGLYEDGDAALAWLLHRRRQDLDSLILYGYSLGNTVSIHLASELVDPLCLIAESPFASAGSLARGSTVLDFPDGWLTEGTYNNAEKIKRIHTPFLLMHGLKDDLIRYEDNGRVVYRNAPEPKQRVEVADADHVTIPEVLGESRYLQIIEDWIAFSLQPGEVM